MKQALLTGSIVAVPTRALPLQTNYGFISLRERTLPPAVLALMQEVRELEAELDAEEAMLEAQFGFAG